jgi:endonuclease YncB( thermonuclease family)
LRIPEVVYGTSIATLIELGLAREGRRLVNRFVRDFAIASALLFAVLLYSQGERLSGTFRTSTSVASGVYHGPMPIERTSFTVTDGDTMQVNGEDSGMRLVGFNTPEVFSPLCSEELELGRKASTRLKELAASADLKLQRVACACPPGTEGTDGCNYGRSCGNLFANGRNVGDVLIAEGLAVSFVCGPRSCPPTPRPWCG